MAKGHEPGSRGAANVHIPAKKKSSWRGSDAGPFHRVQVDGGIITPLTLLIDTENPPKFTYYQKNGSPKTYPKNYGCQSQFK